MAKNDKIVKLIDKDATETVSEINTDDSDCPDSDESAKKTELLLIWNLKPQQYVIFYCSNASSQYHT